MKNMDRSSAPGKALAATAITLLTLSIASAAKAETVRWKTIVGIIQAGNTVGSIGGGGQPWTTTGGRARVDLAKGHVDFDVQGLVLAGGPTVGNPGAVNQVKGTLVCGANTTSQLAILDTPLVTLSPQGDADFSGSIGLIPTTCNATNVVFLVRISADRWIANGAVRSTQGMPNTQ
jgi:hypothetical protein